MKNYKRHPKFRDLRIKSDGSEFRLYNEELEIKEHKGKNGKILLIVRINNVQYSAPKLILETFTGPAPEDGRYYAIYKDGNIDNLHPNNLYWSRSHKIPEQRKFRNSSKSSKLSREQTYEAYRRHRIEGESLTSLAKEFQVSATTIARAIKRYERYLQTLEV